MMYGGRGSCSRPSMRKPNARRKYQAKTATFSLYHIGPPPAQRQDLLHHLIRGLPRRVDDHRVRRDAQRRVRPLAVPPVPLLLRRTEVLAGHLPPLLPPFVLAAAGARPGGGVLPREAASPTSGAATASVTSSLAAKRRAPCGVSRNSNPRVRAISASTAASSSGTPRRSASRATARYIQPVLM